MNPYPENINHKKNSERRPAPYRRAAKAAYCAGAGAEESCGDRRTVPPDPGGGLPLPDAFP